MIEKLTFDFFTGLLTLNAPSRLIAYGNLMTCSEIALIS